MEPDKRPVVIGGGAAGLAACLTLEQAGYNPLLIEASDRLGGRLRTDRLPDGTPVDRGFQVLQTGYPELQRWVDFDALECADFVPGARVFLRNKWRSLADPRRSWGGLPATLTSGIGNWSDRLLVLRLVFKLQRCPAPDIQNGLFDLSGKSVDPHQFASGSGPWAHRSTAEFLNEWGFSEAFVRDFLAPFFSGIFLEGALETPAAQFQYTFRMLADGKVVRPKGGMESLVQHLASQLKRTEVNLTSRVASLTARELVVEGERLAIHHGAIVAAPGVHPGHPLGEWNACLNAVIRTSSPRFGKPIIGLIPGAKRVTNLHFMEDLEGPRGAGRVNATALLGANEDPEKALSDVRRELESAGIQCGEVEWYVPIQKALPRVRPVGQHTDSARLEEGVFVAGDACLAPSLNAALQSGRQAAEELIHWLTSKSQQQF